jgi:Uma2 family endonuclease
MVTSTTAPIQPTKSRSYTLEEYFKREEKALYKHEYHNGKIKKMAGGSFNHDNIASKAIHLILEFLEINELNCYVNGSDTKIRIETHDRVVYADALVVCEKPIFYKERKDTITNPSVIVEVLSQSTRKFDRKLKFDFYKSLESFKEYVLINQDRKRVSVFTKQTDGTWLPREYENEEAIAILYALYECPLSLRRLYRGLEIEAH